MKLIVESHPVISIIRIYGQLQVEHVATVFLIHILTAIMFKLIPTTILSSRETYLQAMVLIICAIDVRQADKLQHITQQLRTLSSK